MSDAPQVTPTADDVKRFVARLTLDEGRRKRPYKDTSDKVSIGVGRNLDDVGLSDDEIDYLLTNDIRRTEAALDARLPWWSTLDAVRQGVLLNMAFNLGVVGLLKFKTTLASVRRGDWAAAAAGMRASLWARQVHDRAERLAQMMETGRHVA